MIHAEDAVAELMRRFEALQRPLLTQDDIGTWSDNQIVVEERLYDEIAADLARGYDQNRYSFEFCDAAVNGLYGVAIAAQFREPQPPWPRLFERVYSAFDAGEYFHDGDDPKVDPAIKYTDPEIHAIVQSLTPS